MDPLQWMGAVRKRVQTVDKNITIIHITPVHQLTSWEVKICVKSLDSHSDGTHSRQMIYCEQLT